VFSAELKEQGERIRAGVKAIVEGSDEMKQKGIKDVLLEVHSIKGSSGALGFTEMEQWALETERAFKRHTGKPVPDALLAVLEAGLSFAIAEADKGAAGGEEKASFKPFIDRLQAI
jgi:HPt (histidine-containing phosphotransfer) domain-containing protein